MRRIPGLRRLFRLPTTTARVTDEVSDEVAFHLDMQARDLEAQGLSPAQAREEALRRFGDVSAARMELGRIGRARVRREWRLESWEALLKDIRYAARGLARQPAFTAFVVATLALGIGANTAMFSIADALVLRTLPVPHANRLVLLRGSNPESRMRTWPNPVWEAIRDRRALHDGAFAFSMDGFDLSERGEADPVEGLRASGGIFDVLGVRALIGRTFTEADDRRGGGPDGPVAVLGYGFWKRRYGGADVVGRTIALNRVPFTIIGVTPPEFFGPEVGRTFDVAIPLGTVALMNGDAERLDSRSSWWLQIMIRLAARQTAEQATARLRAVQRQIAEEARPPNQRPENAARFLTDPFLLTPAAVGSSQLRDSYRKPVMILLGLVAVTLLIACGNIANLMLARTAARRHELSVRTALGASGSRLARQLFTESLLLAAAGAAFGVLVAVWSSRMIVAQLSLGDNPVFLSVGLDWRMLAFTATVAVGTAVMFGTVPAIRATRLAPVEAMKEQGRGTSPGRWAGLAGSLIVAQVAPSLVLLVVAGLFVRSFASLASRDPGFDADRVLVVNIDSRRAGLEPAARAAMFERLLAETRSVPGAERAALSQITPASGSMWNEILELPDRPELSEQERAVLVNVVSPGWFSTLGIPLLAGRDLSAGDAPGAPRAMVVNRAFVAKYVGRGNAIGARIGLVAHHGDDPIAGPRGLHRAWNARSEGELRLRVAPGGFGVERSLGTGGARQLVARGECRGREQDEGNRPHVQPESG
jgi:predicted permease